jgi:hypothetical protein
MFQRRNFFFNFSTPSLIRRKYSRTRAEAKQPLDDFWFKGSERAEYYQ